MTAIEIPPLSADLVKAGWGPEPDDICWLDCPEVGYRMCVSGHELVLCQPHAALLEQSARNGYSQADPPPGRANWWPWQMAR